MDEWQKCESLLGLGRIEGELYNSVRAFLSSPPRVQPPMWREGRIRIMLWSHVLTHYVGKAVGATYIELYVAIRTDKENRLGKRTASW